jgi:general secretion pathway protein K
MSASRHRCDGMALILAMLIAAFASTIAVGLLWQQQRWASDQEHRSDQVQAQALAMAGVSWARQILAEDRRTTTIDHLGEPWALRLPATPIEHGSVTGYIVDAQSRFNVNALKANDARATFTAAALARLFAQSGVATTLVNAMGDWVDADSIVRNPGGAEDDYYLALQAPILTANRPIQRLAELAVARGVDIGSLERVRPFLDAIDADVSINVNTAPAEVLMAAVPGLEKDSATALVRERLARPFRDVTDFTSRLPQPGMVSNVAMFSVDSAYFSVTVEAKQGETVARARALVRRGQSGSPDVVWQTVE